jgi:serine/threonine protein kinase
MAIEIEIDIGGTVKAKSGTYYRILQELGRGGNSVVYLVIAANKECKGVLFALKLFTKISNQERRTRFFQEIDFLRHRSVHPSIMRLYDEGEMEAEAGAGAAYPYVVAEYLPSTLESVIGRELSNKERLSYTLQLLSVLAYLDAQTEPIIHRDIKPKNIFIKGRSCVLGDFGLMKYVASDTAKDLEVYAESTEHGMPFFYRTPDLVEYLNKGTPLTTKSDIFQLGLVLAEMFTGRNPEKRANKLADPVELESIGEIPGAQRDRIKDLITSMLEMDPLKRPRAVDVMDAWDGVFREIADLSHQLDGRLF